jgi:ABC-type arginine transport system ATPase subunit
MSDITLQNITKTFRDMAALDDISIHVNDGEFFVLLGPRVRARQRHCASLPVSKNRTAAVCCSTESRSIR